MSSQNKVNMVFIPFPVISHLVAAVNMAKILADQDECLAITVLIMKLPTDTKISSYTKNSPDSRINFIELPANESNTSEISKSNKTFIWKFLESQKGHARDAVAKILAGPDSGRLAGFVLDMLCTPMIDVANDFQAPSYIFFTCGAAVLGLIFRLQVLVDDENQDLSEYENSEVELYVPTYVNAFPTKVLPSSFFDTESGFLDIARRFREAKGIIVNSFLEFERHAIASLSSDEKIPPVYPVGPILQNWGEQTDQTNPKQEEIIGWLDGQPESSVVFLCFGSNGCFDGDQVKEIAVALENSGHRFLWSLRKPAPKENMEFPGEYENPEEVLPKGFLERTMGIGKVIGWAPQMTVLSHSAVGGFISHCGWNSTLESIWCGVPMAVWPLAAEQQANAFQLVKEFEMAIEIKMDYRKGSDVIIGMDYRKGSDVIIGAERIEKAIKELMDPENEIRVKVRALQEKSRKAMMKGKSSYNFLGMLIEWVSNPTKIKSYFKKICNQ